MKRLSLVLALFGVSCGLYAQQTPFFSMHELTQLVACPTPECFREAVRKKGYELHRKETTDGITILTYRILTEGQNPVYPLHLITYGYKEPRDGRTVGFLTKSSSFPAWLDAELAEAGYTIDGPDDPAEDRRYTRQEGAIRWRLSRYKPKYSPSAGGNSYQINLSGFRQPATPPTESVAKRPSLALPPAENTELPHLGGDWNAKYPAQNAADIFRTERTYAADYDRKHGKTGHTFSRAEKLRIQATYLNQLRPLTDDRWEKSFDLALRTTGFEAFANERRRLFRQEALFDVAGERVWMPIQEILIASLQKEVTGNALITLYAVLTSHHDFGGTLHLSFLVNEFTAPRLGSVDPVLQQENINLNPASSMLITANNLIENFNTFIQRFSADRTFQSSRIKFPFRSEIFINDEKPEIKFTQQINWKHTDYRKPSYMGKGVKGIGDWGRSSDKNIKANSARMVSCGCPNCECGYFMHHEFRCLDGKWFLTKEIVVSN